MLRTLVKSRLHPNEHKPKIKQEMNKFKSYSPAHLQSIKQKLLSGSGFVHHK